MARTPSFSVHSSGSVWRLARALGPSVTLLAAAALADAQSPCGPALRYGLNPSFQTWSSRAIVFADALQRVRSFSVWVNGQPAGPATLIPLGSSQPGAGWPDPASLAPRGRFGAYLFGSMEGTIPDGRSQPFVVTWKGRGSVRLEGVFVVSERARAANRVEVFVDPSRGTGNTLLSVSWEATDARDPVRDVHVWLPGMEGTTQPFWPPFLDKVRATNAGLGPDTWRTLDWTRVNEVGRPLAHGGFVLDRVGLITPASPSQGTLRGVATEYQVALCNALRMNLHFQLPHRTNDLPESEYVLLLEQELRKIRDGSPGIPGLFGERPFERLDPALSVTLELSNEIWNTGFPVNAWMNAEAGRKGISFARQVASQIQLLFDVADGVFAGPDAPRLRTLVAGFAANPGFQRRVLAELRPGTHLDAIGPAAYLGPRRADMDAWLAGSSPGSCPNCPDADGLLAAARNSIDTLRPLLAQHADLARSWLNPDGSHPALELYESGLNLKSIGQPWAPAARALQGDARLFTLLAEELVPMQVEESVSLVNWYSFMSDQDSTLVDAYGFWNDMNQSLSLPVAKPYLDQGAPKAAVLCLGPPLASACPRATATARNVPGNHSSYSATPPVLGGTFHARVDLTTSGNASAFVVATLTPVSVLLPSGQTVLSALDSNDFLSLRSGPLASWDVPVPNDWRLAGIQITTQAFHIGGGPGLNLSNAMDLVFGR